MPRDGYRPVSFPRFDGGLNLRDQPDVVDPTQAIDALNVTFTTRGAVKQRDGYAKLTLSGGTNRYDSLAAFYKTDGTRHLVAGAGNRLEAIDTGGAALSSDTTPTSAPHFFARFGGPTAERLYIANGSDSVKHWDGSAFTTPTYTGTNPNGRFLAVTSWDNRLANARISGTSAGANPSSVIFSEQGDPHTWKVAAPDRTFVDLTPGDGEQIMGMVSWREFLFVFKESKFFVFYGTSVGANGYPVFEYRAVTAGVGLASSRALAVGRDGVYFLDRKGVYRTQGEEPEQVSDLIDPIFLGAAGDFYRGGVLSQGAITNCAMTWIDERIYLAFPTGSTNDRTLVFDPRYGWWTLWDLPAAALTGFRVGNSEDLCFAYASGTNHIARVSSLYTNDDAAAITSRWKSGWTDYDSPVIKAVRESKLWGRGQIQVGIAKDFTDPRSYDSVNFDSGLDTWGDGLGSDTWKDGSNSSDTWGPTGGAIRPKLVRSAIRGTVFSTELKNSTLNQTWRVHRYANHLREQRKPSMTRTEV